MEVNVKIDPSNTLDIERDHNTCTVIVKLTMTPEQASRLLEDCFRSETVETFEVSKRDKALTAVVWTATTIHA